MTEVAGPGATAFLHTRRVQVVVHMYDCLPNTFAHKYMHINRNCVFVMMSTFLSKKSMRQSFPDYYTECDIVRPFPDYIWLWLL